MIEKRQPVAYARKVVASQRGAGPRGLTPQAVAVCMNAGEWGWVPVAGSSTKYTLKAPKTVPLGVVGRFGVGSGKRG
jgi:hypothetical protein